MAKSTNLAVRTTSLDALAPNPPLDAEAVQDWIRQPVDVTLMIDALPQGPDEEEAPAESIATVRGFLDDLAAAIGLAAVKKQHPDRRPVAAA